MCTPAIVQVEPFPSGVAGGIAGGVPGYLLDLRCIWPLVVLMLRTNAALWMNGE